MGGNPITRGVDAVIRDLALFDKVDGVNALLLQRPIRPIRRCGGNAVYLFDALDNFAEGGVLPVKEFGVGVTDEELRGRGIVELRTCHGDNAAFVRERIVDSVDTKFAFDGFFAAAHSRALRITALNHKTRDYSVENESVVEVLRHEFLKILDGERRDFFVKFDDYRVAVAHLYFYGVGNFVCFNI